MKSQTIVSPEDQNVTIIELFSTLCSFADVCATIRRVSNDQQRAVHQILKQRLQQYQQELDVILQTDLPAFNRLMQSRNLNAVITALR